ncbi:conserved Plasmodium protein, unknown function [Plasmodium gallinaceum]|uniref:Uncharacterized protein n=1 Tax=Plasmodium gallinaceum TaxID=5849 RepID=A0A1J1GP15_PLAGA|nr:conserved Plasmodium protein, unknown function [Plasmodium gallinaceum]CRG94038.1 conserved Plasmodium protein, unknown function [Plasmodium gallinaceum]
MLQKVFFSSLCLFLLQLKYVLCYNIKCSSLTNNEEILSYCKNNSECYVKNVNDSEYSSIECKCRKQINDFFFAGPDCSIKIPYHYKTTKNNGVYNTTWLEDLFNLNIWKNEENRVGRICVNPQCS